MAYVPNAQRDAATLEKLRVSRREYQRRFREAKGPAYNNARSKAWRDANPEKVRQINRRGNMRRYGRTTEEYEQLFVAQDGRCALCQGTPTAGRGNCLYQDHDHRTGKNRALLCHHCNLLIGNAREREDVLTGAIAYLRKWQDNGPTN